MSRCDEREILDRLISVLRWSGEREYRGHSKHDALNSPLLSTLSLGNGLLQLVLTQLVMRFPFNIRPLLGVPRRRNPKGIGLFAHACLDLAEYLSLSPSESGEYSPEKLTEEATRLLRWLILHASPQASPSRRLGALFETGTEGEVEPGGPGPPGPLAGLGWGYHYPWRDAGFFQPAHFPNRVVSSWIGFAFLRALEITGSPEYGMAAREIADFLLANPKRLTDTPEQLCLSYVPLERIDWAVMDVSALVSSFCARLQSLGGHGSDPDLLPVSRRLMEFVVDKQTDYGAWFYTWPAGDSHITHDNYHTGIILDCLADYMTFSGDFTYRRNYAEGLEYYRHTLFCESGAPRWMNDRTFPHDVHGAASGILCFARAGLFFSREGAAHNPWLDMAHRVCRWSLENLFDRRGFFYYQKGRLTTKRFCLMRWCNAWMSRALSYLLLAESKISSSALRDGPPPPPG